MEKIVFNVGSIVSPVWDRESRGKVTEVRNSYRVIDWFQGNINHTNVWYDENLTYAMPKESKMNTIKCKPVSNAIEIEGGNWKYVVVNRHENKIVAAFISEMDAETYVQSYSGVFYIREIDDGQ